MTALGDYLRARREHVQPSDVGLPGGGRRRTPGLRREEVASLAGVSIDYLVRLEQGRDTHPSAPVLVALADALLLEEDERRHLFRLAAISSTPELCPSAREPRRDVRPNVKHLLDRFDPTPAFVVGAGSDVLAWNETWQRLVAPLGLLDELTPNLPRYVFLHPRARDAFANWGDEADEQIGRLRAAGAHCDGDNEHTALIDELQQDDEFATRWSRAAGKAPAQHLTALRHPGVGELRFECEVLRLADDDHELIAWLPADDATARAVAAIGSDVAAALSPAQLRVIR